MDNLDAVGDHVGLDIIVVVEALEVGQSFTIGGGIEGNSVVCGCDKGLDLDRTFEGHASTSSDHRGLVSIRRLPEQTDHPNRNWNRGWEVGHSISLTRYSQECNVHKATRGILGDLAIRGSCGYGRLRMVIRRRYYRKDDIGYGGRVGVEHESRERVGGWVSE